MSLSQPPSVTPTVVDPAAAETQNAAQPAPADVDVEKAPPKPAMPTFPEGSLKGWLAVAGSWLVLFATFGMANTYGVFQSYYQFQGYPNETASTISWIGSVQLFFQFSLGAVSGPLYDKGYFYHLMIFGSVLYVVAFFMISLCTEFWQTFLAQGVALGIGIGIIFLPGLSVLSQYFFKRRALAIGIAVTGSSTGGICLPIMLNNLIVSHGFKKAVQYTGYLLMGCLILACSLMHPRLKANKNAPKKPSPKQLLQDTPYAIAVLGLFVISWGFFFPFFYLQVFAETHGISQKLVFYTLAILNGASVFGRVTPNFLADKYGSLNLMIVGSAAAGVIIFGIFGAGTPGGLIAISILYGFFSGAYVSLLSPALISFAQNHSEIGLRLGLGFLCASLSALTGTPIIGALLDKYGFFAPIVWSGVTVLSGCALLTWADLLQRKRKGTWKV